MFLAGCGTGQDYEIGQRAERNQEPQVAYDAYLRAASQNPDNSTIKSALQRVTPKAAEYWEKQGHLAVGERRYADAWRDFMRVLEIRPDHPSAPLVIRQLEQQHPTEVAYARQEYEQRGARSLATTGQGSGSTQIAQAGDGRNSRTSAADLGTEDDYYQPPTRVRSTPPPPLPPTATGGPYGQYGAQSGPGSTASATYAAPAPTPAPAPVAYNPPAPKHTPEPTYPPTVPVTVRPVVNSDAGPPAGFMVVRTLSKKDRRYARRREFVDGVAIRLDDVDDNDAELELYMGGIKFAEVKDIHVNETVSFVGQTGRRFRLVVLDIRHSTDTVRVGVSPQ